MAPLGITVSRAFKCAPMLVKVGPKGEEYYLHPELLQHQSVWFRRALESAKARKIGFILLEDIEPAHFQHFINWIYSEGGVYKVRETHDRMVHAYVVADYLVVPRMKEWTLEYIYATYKDSAPYYDTVMFAYSRLKETDPLLELLADSQAMNWEGGDVDTIEDKATLKDLPPMFLYNAMAKMHEYKKKNNKAFPPLTKYKKALAPSSKEKAPAEEESGEEELDDEYLPDTACPSPAVSPSSTAVSFSQAGPSSQTDPSSEAAQSSRPGSSSKASRRGN